MSRFPSRMMMIALSIILIFPRTGIAQKITASAEFESRDELPSYGDHQVSYTAPDDGFVALHLFGTKKEPYYGITKFDAALNKKWSKQLAPKINEQQKFMVYSVDSRIFFIHTNHDTKTKLTELIYYQFDLEGNVVEDRKVLHTSTVLNGVKLVTSEDGKQIVLIPCTDMLGHKTLSKGKTAIEANYFTFDAGQNTMVAKKATITGIKDMYLRFMEITSDGRWRFMGGQGTLEVQLLDYNPASNSTTVLVDKIFGAPCSMAADDNFIVASYVDLMNYKVIQNFMVYVYTKGKGTKHTHPLPAAVTQQLATTAKEHNVPKQEVLQNFVQNDYVRVSDGFYFFTERQLREYPTTPTKVMGDPDRERSDMFDRVAANEPEAYCTYELLVSFVNNKGELEWMKMIDKSCWADYWMPRAVPVAVGDDLYFIYENREKKFYVGDLLFSKAEAMVTKIDRQGNISTNTLFPEYKMWNGFYNHRSRQVSDKTALLCFYKKEVKKMVLYRVDF